MTPTPEIRHEGSQKIVTRVRNLTTPSVLAAAALAATLFVGAAPAAAQHEDIATRLAERLPEEARATVLARIEEAAARGVPAGPLADLALQGMAKGRSGDEVLAALDGLVGDLTRARETLSASGRGPDDGEVEAAALALRMGVDPDAVAALARSGPSARSLSVPLLVLGGLSQRGLPSDEALGHVLNRLAARADDAGLLADVPGLSVAAGRGNLPEGLTPGPSGARGPGRPDGVPAVPVGPSGGGRPPVDRPGHGGRPDTGDLPGGPGGAGPGGA